MGSDVYKLDRLADYLIPDTSIIAINSHLIKPVYRKEIKNLKELKLITYTLPVLSCYKHTAFNNESLFSTEMKRSYETMELCAVQIVTQIGAIMNHTWKYGENASHVAEQFVFLFDSIFHADLPLTSKLTDEQTRSFLLESFNDLYLHRQIQLIVHSIFLGLDKIELRNSIIEMLELKYEYKIPGHLFVVAVSSLGLQLYRNELERNHEYKLQKLNKVFRWKKKGDWHKLRRDESR